MFFLHFPTQSMPEKKAGHQLVRVPDSSKYVLTGGQYGYKEIYLFESDTKSWEEMKEELIEENNDIANTETWDTAMSRLIRCVF